MSVALVLAVIAALLGVLAIVVRHHQIEALGLAIVFLALAIII